MPLWVTSEKQEHAARTIRPKITKNLPKYLTEYPPVVDHPYGDKSMVESCENPFLNWKKLMDFLEINKQVKEVEWAKPGTKEGLKMLKSFLDERLPKYETKRNDPNENALSNLSPWKHFGMRYCFFCRHGCHRPPSIWKGVKEPVISTLFVFRTNIRPALCFRSEQVSPQSRSCGVCGGSSCSKRAF